jgi:hypothetical protein
MEPTAWQKREAAARKRAKEERQRIAKGIEKNTTTIQSSVQPSWKEDRLTTLKTIWQKRQDARGTMSETEKSTEQSSALPTTTGQTSRSVTPEVISDSVGSVMMNSLDESAQHLMTRIKEQKLPVADACRAIETLVKVVRLKHDIRRSK